MGKIGPITLHLLNESSTLRHFNLHKAENYIVPIMDTAILADIISINDGQFCKAIKLQW